jgi:hypothetical protein
MDLTFDAGLLQLDAGAFDPDAIVQAPFNGIATNGSLDNATGLVDDLGGVSIASGLGTAGPVHFARLMVTATAPGTAQIQAGAGALGFSILGGGNLHPSFIDYGAALSIEVGADQRPVAHAADVTAAYETPVLVDLTGTDPEGAGLTFNLPSEGDAGYPAHGLLTLVDQTGVPAGHYHVRYTPAAGFSGTDTFTFTVSDAALTSAAATVTLEVKGFKSDLVVFVDEAQMGTVTFGAVPGASDGVDPADGDVAAGLGAIAYFTLDDGLRTIHNLNADIRALTDDTESVVWLGELVVGAGATMTLAWDPDTVLPSAWYGTIQAAGASVNMETEGTISVTNTGDAPVVTPFQLYVARKVSVEWNLVEGWNLVGVPIELDAASQAAIRDHEDILSVLGYTEATGYYQPATLEASVSYWVFAAEPLTLELTGRPVAARGAVVQAGWNFVCPDQDSVNPVDGTGLVLACYMYDAASGGYVEVGGRIDKPCKAGVAYLVYAVGDGVIWSE